MKVFHDCDFFLPNYTSSYSWRCLVFLQNLQARKTTTRTARVHKPRARRITSVFVNFLSSSSSETYKETNKQTNIGYWPLLIKICYKSCPIFFNWGLFVPVLLIDQQQNSYCLIFVASVCLSTQPLLAYTIWRSVLWIEPEFENSWEKFNDRRTKLELRNDKDLINVHNRSMFQGGIIQTGANLEHSTQSSDLEPSEARGNVVLCNKHSALVDIEKFNLGNDGRLQRVTSPFGLIVTSTL